MKRQSATASGLKRRIRDMGLDRVTDPRVQNLTKNPLPAIVASTVAAMVSGAAGLRGVETRTEQIANKHRGWLAIAGRIADNTVGALLRRLCPKELAECLHRLIKAEARRGNLKPTRIGVATVAIDGKNLATLPWHELCRLAELDPQTATPREVKVILKKKCPEVQVCEPKRSEPHGLVRCHTATIISSDAACCAHVRNIPGATSEVGALPEMLRELYRAYFKTSIVELITVDAGNFSKAIAAQIVKELNWDFFAQLKGIHGQIYKTIVSSLGMRAESHAEHSYTEKRDGRIVTYHVWRHALSAAGWIGWPHARLLIRVQRQVTNPRTGKTTTGNRYYVCSRIAELVSAADCLTISRLHWRCENETHWTADAVLLEDARRLRWSRHSAGIVSSQLSCGKPPSPYSPWHEV